MRIDDQVVGEALASEWRNQAAYVPQDVVLFDARQGLEHTMSVVLITHRPELLRLVDRVIEVEVGVAA